MSFVSVPFLILFGVLLVLLRLAPGRESRQVLILVASLVFYAWWNPIFLLLLATPSVIDYVCSLRIEEARSDRKRRAWLLASLISNVGLLAYFKYANFFVGSARSVLGLPPVVYDITLPVGISFYTFKTLSYTIDVYRREIPACRSFWRYSMFVTYFPELVAGPIVRASVFLPQLPRSLRPSLERAQLGGQLVLLGMTKKLVVADQLARFVDPVFAGPGEFGPVTAWMAAISYGLQIYCDFSGYSDMAIGISKILGYDLPENFNMPYLSTSVVEFWQRWHITLSQWLRDYLFFSLGGMRSGNVRRYGNLMITMLVGGLWHGANWTFVLWGAAHGCALVVNHMWARWRGRDAGLWKPVSWLATMLFLLMTWVLFRAQSLGTAAVMYRKMFGLDLTGEEHYFLPLLPMLVAVAVAHWMGVSAASVAGRAAWRQRKFAPEGLWQLLFRRGSRRFAVRPSAICGIYVMIPDRPFLAGFTLTCWFLLLAVFAAIDASPFLYFQF